MLAILFDSDLQERKAYYLFAPSTDTLKTHFKWHAFPSSPFPSLSLSLLVLGRQSSLVEKYWQNVYVCNIQCIMYNTMLTYMIKGALIIWQLGSSTMAIYVLGKHRTCNFSVHKTGCLRSPSQTLKAWKILEVCWYCVHIGVLKRLESDEHERWW